MEDSRYHYLNTLEENYNDNINMLQQKFLMFLATNDLIIR